MQTINKIPGKALESETIQGSFYVGAVEQPNPGFNIMDKRKKHGLWDTKLWKIWDGMLRRCYYKKDAKRYKNYGGRGIKVCDEWKMSFLSFYNWAKDKYQKGLQIDRIEVNGNYEPDNCRFVTQSENLHNRRYKIRSNSGYLGVSYSNDGKRIKRWIASTMINKKHYYLGRYKTAKEGAIAYNNFVQSLSIKKPLNIINNEIF